MRRAFDYESGASIFRTEPAGEVEYNLVITGCAWPGRPAPHCSNPDSPNFSDPGDPPEIEIWKAVVEEALVGNADTKDSLIKVGQEIELTDAEAQKVEDQIWDVVFDDRREW